MRYEITDAEIMRAKQALFYFKKAKNAAMSASKFLNKIKTPFKDNPEPDPEELYKERFFIRKFRDQSIDKFNKFKKIAFKCVFLMQDFSSDTQNVKIMKSFINSVDTLEDKVNKFLLLYDDLKDKDFSKKLVEKINIIQKHIEELCEIIEDRVISHIQKDILSTTWVDSVSKELNINIDKKMPLVVELYRERQKQLNT